MKWMRLLTVLVALTISFSATAVITAGAGESGGETVDSVQAKDLQERMLNDPGIMALILAMENDPEIQTLVGDPKVLEAVRSGDLNALVNDPRFLRLLTNPKVKQIGERLDRKESGGDR